MVKEGDLQIGKAVFVLLFPVVFVLVISQLSLVGGPAPGTGFFLIIIPAVVILLGSLVITAVNVVRARWFDYERGLLDTVEHVCSIGVVLSFISLLVGLDLDQWDPPAWIGTLIYASLWGITIFIALQFLIAFYRGWKSGIDRY